MHIRQLSEAGNQQRFPSVPDDRDPVQGQDTPTNDSLELNGLALDNTRL